MINVMAASLLEVAINQGLSLALNQYEDNAARRRMQALDGKVVAIDLLGVNTSFYLIFSGESIHVQSQLQGQADTRIAGTPLTLLRTGMEGRRSQGLFSGEVTITGDTEPGRQVNALLDELDIDWEEQLSHVLGDVLAHEIGSRARSLGEWARRALETLERDGGEYLREEARILVSRRELEDFLAAVDACRDDAARLEQRLARIQQQITGESA